MRTKTTTGRRLALALLLIAAACGSDDLAMAVKDIAVEDAPADPAVGLDSHGVGPTATDFRRAERSFAVSAGAAGAPPAPPVPGATAAPGATATEFAFLPAAFQDPAQIGMLIRSGTAWIEVDSLDAGVSRVRALAASVGGQIANVSMHAGVRPRSRQAVLEMKVPADRFDETVAGLDPIGRVEAVNVQVKDVGEEYVDISARLANARRLEERLLEILRERTGELDDVLTVERELARVREEIERYEGRLRYLRARAAVSTLAVTISEPQSLLASAAGPSPIRHAVRRAWRNFVELIATLIAASGFVLPIGGALVLGVWSARRIRRRGGARTAVTAAGGA